VKILIREALAYTAVSGFALTVDIGILWILVHYFAWPYLPAAAASFLVGLLLGYGLSVAAVFKYRRLKSQPLELASFTAIGVVGLGINVTVISFGVRYLGAHFLIAKCGAAALTFTWNFAARRQMLFVPRRAAT
jgi:putative flippase GtrA